jgi:muconolactone D-isomerase
MLFFVNVRIDPKNLSLDQMWDVWEKEAEAAIAARSSGKIVNLWKVAGQRVLAVVDVSSHDEMDQIFMGALPMAHNLEFEQILSIRECDRFAADLKALEGVT